MIFSKNVKAAAKMWSTMSIGLSAGFVATAAHQGFLSQDVLIVATAIALTGVTAVLCSFLVQRHEARFTSHATTSGDMCPSCTGAAFEALAHS